MQLPLDAPLPARGDRSSPRTARPRRWLEIAAAVVLSLGAAAVFLLTYDPLCGGPCRRGGGLIGPTARTLGYFTSPQGDQFTAYRVRHHAGETFSFWFTLTNDGPLGVTLTAVGSNESTTSPIRIVRLQLTRNGTTGPPLEAFTPTYLGPDSARNVLITVRMQECLPEGDLSFTSVPVTFRTFGITHTTTVVLPERIEVIGRPDTACPGPE